MLMRPLQQQRLSFSVLLLSLVAIPTTAHADIIYNIKDYEFTNDFTLDGGSITTDGTLGVIPPERINRVDPNDPPAGIIPFIKDYSIQFTSPGPSDEDNPTKRMIDLTPVNSRIVLGGNQLFVATATELQLGVPTLLANSFLVTQKGAPGVPDQYRAQLSNINGNVLGTITLFDGVNVRPGSIVDLLPAPLVIANVPEPSQMALMLIIGVLITVGVVTRKGPVR